jgi:hypothetical protein
MQNRISILLALTLLVVAALLVFRGELHAHDPRHPNGEAKPVTCGFWGDMSAGMSCR